MKKYTAINIGPILDTFAMAKKPRELWNASYMFSFLMECIIDELSGYNIISPAVLDWSKPFFFEAGLYPDRVFIEGEINAKEAINKALAKFKAKTGVGNDYVNVMSVSIEYNQPTGAIKELNRLLDCLELYQRPVANNSLKNMTSLLYGKNKEILYEYATCKSQFTIPSLAEIATHRLGYINLINWSEACRKLDSESESEAGEDTFYQSIKEEFKDVYKSYYKYICVVQADGDNMGKIVSSLETSKVKTLSESLLMYGSDACKLIKLYGGLPIYAGGDDLLFIAPVISSIDLNAARATVESFLSNDEERGKSPKSPVTFLDLFSKVLKVDSIGDNLVSIFDLLATIDELYRKVDDKVGKLGRPSDWHTSISYGLSISYYKYPLYEALKSAREMLFDKAKNVDGKNAIAWCLRKHSGSGFTGSFCKGTNINTIFSELLKTSVGETTVSAVAHKLRDNDRLLDIIRDKDENRIKAFYKKVIEENPLDDTSYKGITRRLLYALFKQAALVREKREKNSNSELDNEDLKTGKILEILYGMLRTAKFINGEGDNDE